MSDVATQTAPAPEAQATPTPAQAEVTTEPVAPTAPVAQSAPALTPEQDAAKKQQDAQEAIFKVIKAKEDQCAAEIQALCEKHGCELIVGHSVKVKFKQ